MTIGELITLNAGCTCDYIKILKSDTTILNETKMCDVHQAWFSFDVRMYMTYADDDKLSHFVVCINNPVNERRFEA